MFTSLSLVCFLLHVSTSSASPSVPVSTQAIVTTITAPTVSNIFSTSQTVIESTSTFEDVQTITTVDSNGDPLTTTVDNGATSTVIDVTSDLVVTIPITAFITFESTIGQSTILGPDPTTSAVAATSTTPAAAAALTTSSTPSSVSVVNVSPTTVIVTEASSYVSSSMSYASVATSSSTPASTTTSVSSQTSSTYQGSSGFPTNTPPRVQKTGMSTGAKAAIGTAVVVACVLLAIFLFWLDRLRRQRKAIREQYPAGQAPGDEAGIFGFFQPIVGKPYASEQKDINLLEKPTGLDRKPSDMVRELHQDDLTPPAVEEPQQQPYRRPIPQRNPHSPHGIVSPISPVHDAMPPIPAEHRSYLPDHSHELATDPFQKGFPRPLSRFPSHHATRSSGNVNALPKFYEKG